MRPPVTGVLIVGAVTLLACLVLLGLWGAFGGWGASEPRMRVGILRSVDHAPMALARARGALDPGRVLVVEFGSAEALHNAFLDGNVHAAFVWLDDALQLIGPPREARVVRVVAYARDPLAMMARADGPELASMRGRRIGLESGPRAMAALHSMLARVNVRTDEVAAALVGAESGPGSLERRVVDAVVVPTSRARDAASPRTRLLAHWQPDPPGEPIVLVASEQALRLAAGQVAYLSAAWDSGVVRLARPRPEDAAWMSIRAAAPAAAVEAELANVRFLTQAEDRELRDSEGRLELASELDAIVRRWRSIGIADTIPPAGRWQYVAARGRS